jgi:hypothetical protein
MLYLDESKVERVGVDDIVFDALAPRVRDMPPEGRRPRGSARLLEQKVTVEERDDDIAASCRCQPVSAPGANRHSVTRTCGSEMWTRGVGCGRGGMAMRTVA